MNVEEIWLIFVCCSRLKSQRRYLVVEYLPTSISGLFNLDKEQPFGMLTALLTFKAGPVCVYFQKCLSVMALVDKISVWRLKR